MIRGYHYFRKHPNGCAGVPPGKTPSFDQATVNSDQVSRWSSYGGEAEWLRFKTTYSWSGFGYHRPIYGGVIPPVINPFIFGPFIGVIPPFMISRGPPKVGFLVSNIFYFHPETWGKWFPIWRAYFSNGLVQPPTSDGWEIRRSPLKFNIEPENDRLVQMIFLCKRGVFSGFLWILWVYTPVDMKNLPLFTVYF